MQILIAPNAFKQSLTAQGAAAAIEKGLLQSGLQCSCERFPVGDGGDGTGELLIEKMHGKHIYAPVKDPLGRIIDAPFGLIENKKTAVIEMASASGLRLLKPQELNPLRAISYGTGQQIKLAIDEGADKIIVAIGGSATVDGGCGLLQALGMRFLDERGEEIIDLPEGLLGLASIDMSLFDRRVQNIDITVLCDVDNQLLGEQGAAAVFGPQKGASSNDVLRLDAALENYAKVILKQTCVDVTRIPSGGAAGGSAAALYAFMDARLVNGCDYFLDTTDFNQSLEIADVVITGEGSIDEQTLQGKAPFGVARRAKARGLPVIALAGKVPLVISASLSEYFDTVLPICNEPMDLSIALQRAADNITRTSRSIGEMLNLRTSYRLL